jgi:hypothetical protein
MWHMRNCAVLCSCLGHTKQGCRSRMMKAYEQLRTEELNIRVRTMEADFRQSSRGWVADWIIILRRTCREPESVTHLFFYCCVARTTWECVSKVCERVVGTDFESVAKLWPNDKKLKVVNVCTTSTLWAIWKLGNDFWVKLMSFVFRGQVG